MDRIPIIIPAYEPDDRMITLINNLKESFAGPIIIVNDGSEKEYDEIFEKCCNEGCTVLKNYRNCGKGRALKNAFNHCLNEYPDLLGCITADSDGQHKVKDILKCKEALEKAPASLVLGCRNFNSAYIPVKSKFGNNLTRRVCKLLCGMNVSDTQTGLRGIPKDFMADLLNTPGERFEFETRMLIEAKERYPIVEVEIETVYDSKENHRTHFDPVKDSIRIYKIFGAVFVKFLFSSLSSSVIDLWLFQLFVSLLKKQFHSYVAVATVLARIISASYNYLINYKLVFNSSEKHTKSVIKYFGLAVLQMSFSAVFTSVGCLMLPVLPELIIKIVVDVVLFFISYSIQREYVFR